MPPKTNHPTVWAWGSHKWDPDDVDQVDYVRAGGGLIAHAASVANVTRAATIAHATEARLAIRVHPYNGPFWRPKSYDARPLPDYDGPEEWAAFLSVYYEVSGAIKAAGDEPIPVVFVDVETWQRDRWRSVELNAAMTEKHAAVRWVIRQAFVDAGHAPPRVEWYNWSPYSRNMTLDEPTESASGSLYQGPNFARNRELLSDLVAFQVARGLKSTTAFVSLGAHVIGGRFTWPDDMLGGDKMTPGQAHRLGGLFRNFRHWSVHDVVSYTYRHPKFEDVAGGPTQNILLEQAFLAGVRGWAA